jgi:PqqD family protein of HPr-rel-A system
MPATSAAKLPQDHAYRIPDGVEFLRWDGGDEWVVYHSGTGETLRLSDGALAILDVLAEKGPLDSESLTKALAEMVDDCSAMKSLGEAVSELRRVLLQHECIEEAPCA